jgi:hypothetical protein
VSDIDIAVVDSLKVLDPKRPIEADMAEYRTGLTYGINWARDVAHRMVALTIARFTMSYSRDFRIAPGKVRRP